MHKLAALENKDNLKIFPRHFFDSSIRKSCETFCRKAGLRFKAFSGKVEMERRLSENFSKHSPKDRLSVNTGLIEALEDKDFLKLYDDSNAIGFNLWKMKDPFKGKTIPKSYEHLDPVELKQGSRDIDRKKVFSDIWSALTKDGVPGLYGKSFEFILEFQDLKRKTDCSTGAI